jgi:hypothetical protein
MVTTALHLLHDRERSADSDERSRIGNEESLCEVDSKLYSQKSVQPKCPIDIIHVSYLRNIAVDGFALDAPIRRAPWLRSSCSGNDPPSYSTSVAAAADS